MSLIAMLKIRDAVISDVKAMHTLISGYAEYDRMLFRSLSDLYEQIHSFKVAEDDGQVVGCCALKVLWEDLAEVQSLAVDRRYFGKKIGTALVKACLEKARQLGLKRVFTLTLEPEFFEKVGFKRVDRQTLPMKVWSDCAQCPKQDHCDEVALEYTL
jgi:amino-acid N-acetyltransferase